uniref:E3 ubiquitin-protein ligase UBR5-like isoform X2 n=1 Tax=Myxine glutinosa TaxID=7769 RepID=UPI00358F993B
MEGTPAAEELGEALYERITAKGGDNVPQLTGMLLELGEGEVRRMLREPSWLDRRLDQATAALQNADDPDSSTEPAPCCDSVGEKLYVLVEDMEPQAAPYITGMLLELDPPALQAVLADPTSRREAVQKAKEALVVARHGGNNHKQTVLLTADGWPHEQPYQDNDKPLDVYESIGMLLEIPLGDLRTLVQLPKQLNEKIALAAQALGEES